MTRSRRKPAARHHPRVLIEHHPRVLIEWRSKGPMPAPWKYEVATRNRNRAGQLSQEGTPVRMVTDAPANYTTVRDVMAIFDSLPGRVRRALTDAAHPWAPHWADEVLQEWSIDDVVERLRRADELEAKAYNHQLLRGTDQKDPRRE